MIEIVSEEKCVECDLCIKVCPTNVFDRSERGIPLIARKDDCQTCFLCEAYCPTDALYVAPEAHESLPQDEGILRSRGLIGSYREALGWGAGRKSTAEDDLSYAMFREPVRPE